MNLFSASMKLNLVYNIKILYNRFNLRLVIIQIKKKKSLASHQQEPPQVIINNNNRSKNDKKK